MPNAYNEHTKGEVKDIFAAAGVPTKKVVVLNESLAGIIGYIRAYTRFACVLACPWVVGCSPGRFLARSPTPSPQPHTYTQTHTHPHLCAQT